jgi:glycosyltransferase involved in cell wall biosynthesis
MKITYLHQYFNTPDMAGGTRSFEMARRLVAKGHQVNMVTSWRGGGKGKDWFETKEAGITVHWLPVNYSNNMSYLKRFFAFIHFAIKSTNKVIALNADVIFATSTPLTIAIPAIFGSKFKKIPMVFEVRDLWPEMPIAIGALKNPILKLLAKFLEKWAYGNAKFVVALSPGIKLGVLATGYPAMQVAVIPNSCDNQEFTFNADAAAKFRSQRPWLKDQPLLIYTGTFGRVNGLDYAVNLAKSLKDINSNVRILLVGSGSERSFIVKKSRQLGVFEDNLFFESDLPKNTMPALFSAATMASNLVIDLPEARANSANKFFDTLASGKPILLNHGGWMHDLILKHGCGFAAWGQSIETVAVKIDVLMNDPVWLNEAGKASAYLAGKYFDRDLLANQLEDVLFASLKNGSLINVEDIAPGIY